jgi:hypothetical protein
MTNKSFVKQAHIVAVFFASIALDNVHATETSIKEQPHRIYHTIKNKTLTQAANQIANRSGISFEINTLDQADIINKKLAADDWKTAVSQLLQGYNYTTILDKGAIKTVIVTGENGSGITTKLVAIHPILADTLPETYKNYKLGSVMPVTMPLTEMKKTPIGKTLTLDLPIGQYRVKHDNFVDHGDGTSTWMGYLDEEGKGYRIYLSQGETGLMGNVYTPDGVYNIETDNGQTLLVDLENSGLQSAGYHNDQASNATSLTFLNTPALVPGLNPKTAGQGFSVASLPVTSNAATTKATGTGPVVDLMVLYTTTKQTAAYAKQRARYLVDVSNQAFKDSKINMRIRLVHTRATRYIESNNNDQALTDLTNNRGAFAGVSNLRNQYGADLVMLLRPLYAKTAGGCGVAYVGFAYGSGAYPGNAYGVIGNGSSKDSWSNYYCDTRTFAHEIGHTLGNVHDREYTNFAGKFSYSYAWGVDGRFGTIMSYKSPSLMLFSTPSLPTQCKSSPCGYSSGSYRSSDQSRTINYTAPFVANYRPKKVTTPIIQ